MSLTPAELIEAAKAVNQPPFTSNVALAAKLRAMASQPRNARSTAP